MNRFDGVKGLAVALGAAVSACLGAIALPAALLAAANVMDYITGLLAAPQRGQRRSSQRGLQGIAKKVGMWLLVAVGILLDILLEYTLQTAGFALPVGFALASLVCVWLVANECLSILENLADAGVALPPFLRPVLEWLKAKTEEKGHGPGKGED